MNLLRRGYRRYFALLFVVALFFYLRSAPTGSPGSSKPASSPTLHLVPPADGPIDSEIVLVRAVITHHSFRTSWQMKYLDQLKMFHRSWAEMIKTQKPNWRTDFVIIGTKTIPLFHHLNCSTVMRQNRTQASSCFVITDFKPTEGLYYTDYNVRTLEWKKGRDYEFIDSIAIAADPEGHLDVYDYLFRCDEDSFLTPFFGQWHDTRFHTGSGEYIVNAAKMTLNRLENIALRNNLTNQGLVNIGATWYGRRSTLKACAKLSLDMMHYMSVYEFTPYEKSEQISSVNWADWHFGVLTLYSGHLAINHCTTGDGVVVQPLWASGRHGDYSYFIDAQSVSHRSTEATIHIHCWGSVDQEFDYFDKGKFEGSYYNNRSLAALNLSIIRDYSLYMAVDSRLHYPLWNAV